MSVPWVRSLTRRPAQRSIMSFAPDMLHLIVRTRSPHNKRNLFVSLAAVSDFLFSTSIVAPPPHHKSGWGGDLLSMFFRVIPLL